MNPALLFFLAAAFVGGGLIALQAPTNALLARGVGSAVNAALLSFVVGTVALLGVAAALGARPAAGEVGALPWYAWIGGFYGAFFVAVAAFAAPRMGVTYVLMVAIAGQLAMALLLDQLGAFGLTRVEISPARIAGMLLALAGAFLVRRRPSPQRRLGPSG